MKRSQFTEEQVICTFRQAEASTRWGMSVGSVAEATFYAAHLGEGELRRLRQLEEENARLERLVVT